MALVLAVGLVLMMLMLGTATIVNTVSHKNPTATLGEPTAQVLSGLMGGIVGLLGAYIGYRTRS